MHGSKDIKNRLLQVLVVDDEAGSSEYLSGLLNVNDLGIQISNNGAEALEILRRSEIHLILANHNLPDMSGYDVVQQGKQINPDAVGIIISDAPISSYKKLIQHGVDDFVCRPFPFEALVYLIKKYSRYVQVLERNRHLNERLLTEQEKGNFFFEVGHQLKTPIAVLKEFSHLFQEGFGGEITEKQNLYLNAIDQNIQRLLYLVDNIEKMNKVERGSWTIRMSNIDPGEIVNQVTACWHPILQQRNYQLVEEIADHLPKVQADSSAVEQVLFNLVDNASKYSPAGSTITLRCFQLSDSCVCIDVEDQGRSIPEEKRKTVFQPFSRLPEHESVTGLGLGLTVAQGLMKRMGGNLQLDDSGKSGNRFRLHLNIDTPYS